MSNWGIGLVFDFGPGARPDVLYVIDIEVACPVCGAPHVERRYPSTAFHTVTTAWLRRELTRRPSLSGECAQCGETISGAAAARWVLRYGLPSGRGLIEGFADAGGEALWRLSPHRSLDVQVVPTWSPEDDVSVRTAVALTEALLQETLGRPLSAKDVARGALVDGVHALSDALAYAVVPAGVDIDGLVRELGAPGAQWVVAPIATAGALQGGYAGAPSGWLAGRVRADRDVWGLADASAIPDAMATIVAGFPIRLRVATVTGGTFELVVEEQPLDAPLLFNPSEIAYESARSLSDPRDVARLELDRALHALTGIWSADPPGVES